MFSTKFLMLILCHFKFGNTLTEMKGAECFAYCILTFVRHNSLFVCVPVSLSLGAMCLSGIVAFPGHLHLF